MRDAGNQGGTCEEQISVRAGFRLPLAVTVGVDRKAGDGCDE